MWGGSSTYPLFAIDLLCETAVNSAFAAFDDSRSDMAKINALCEACYTSEHWPFRLFLPKSPNGHFEAEPVDPIDGYVVDTVKGLGGKADDQPEGAVDISVEMAPLGEAVEGSIDEHETD